MSFTFRFVLVFAALALSSTAFAQTPQPQTPNAHESEDAAARLLYERGAEALQAGDYQTALDRFQQAYNLSHRPQLLYNIGTTLDRLRRDREALSAFRQFLAEVPDHPRRPEVEARVRALESAIAEADRQSAEAEQRSREERERIEAARQQAERDAEQARRAREEAERRAAEANDGLPPAVTISLGGAAVAAGALGIVFGVRTNQLNDDYRQAAAAAYDLTPNHTVTSQQYADIRSMRDDAHSAQRVTNICLFSSAALAAGAVTLIFFTDWGGDESSPAQARNRAMPVLSFGPGGGYAGISRRF